jgi:galactose-1-phosphate uridylyltransferase
MSDARCEVIFYAPEHEATFWSLSARRARRVIDLWQNAQQH